MMARPTGKRDEEQIRSAIEEFLAGEKLNDIAARRGVKQPTISYWLRKWGDHFFPGEFKLRKQGRRKATEPCKRDKQILRLFHVDERTTGEIAQKYKITRTRVAAIVKTWHERKYNVKAAA